MLGVCVVVDEEGRGWKGREAEGGMGFSGGSLGAGDGEAITTAGKI